MGVAEKIKERREYEEELEMQMDEDLDISNLLNDDEDEEEHKETQSENLFDKMRKKGISNENFESLQPLNSHRSLTVLDKLKKDKKRSLEVTGRILKVLGDRAGSKNSDGYLDEIEDGDDNLNEDEMCFLHPLSKKKK